MIRAILDAPRAVQLAAAAWGVGLAVAGIVATKLDAWYYTLRFPTWKPPDWLFGPAWTTIFTCAAAAAILGWTAPSATGETHLRIGVTWLVNACFNVLWSVLFFRLHRPDWALVSIPFLLGSIVAMMWAVHRTAPIGVALLLPYLAWVSFAGVLNRWIALNNSRPTGW